MPDGKGGLKMYTYHSIERTVERAGLNRKAAIRMIENARTKGKEARDFGKPEREFLEKKTANGRKVLIYAGYCFFFDDQEVCITMFSVPAWFGKTMFQGKKQIRKPRRYYRRYAENIADYGDYAA